MKCAAIVICVWLLVSRIAAKSARDIMGLGVSRRETTMGELIVLDAYRRTCPNCLWHDDAHGACQRPGGWEWDKRYTRCITFVWRYGRPGIQKEK